MTIALGVMKDKLKDLKESLQYALYVCTHPLDGFWDLSREGRGSLAAANVIIILALIINILSIQHTSFLFNKVIWEEINIIEVVLGFIAPIIIATAANWGLTTLFDGKGTAREIYMALGYSLTPYVLIQFPLIILSNGLAVDEGAFLAVLSAFSYVWVGILIYSAVMQIHDFTPGKAILVIVATIIGMLLIVFVLLLFFSLISDAVAYFISLFKEIAFRFY